MSDRGLIEGLKTVGFSDHEARTYVALYALGPATAYEIAKQAGLPNSNTYSVIRALLPKGAVRRIADKPSRYVAVEPSDLLSALAQEITSTCTSIVAQFEAIRPKREISFVEIIPDERAIIEKIASCIDQARHQILLKADSNLPDRIADALVRAGARGVQCLFVHFGDIPPFLAAAPVSCWLHEGNGDRLGMGADYLTICCDARNALIYRLDPDPEGTYSENQSFVYMIGVMLRHEIYIAEIIGKFGVQIEEMFGPGLYDLRTRFNSIPAGSPFDIYVKGKRS